MVKLGHRFSLKFEQTLLAATLAALTYNNISLYLTFPQQPFSSSQSNVRFWVNCKIEDFMNACTDLSYSLHSKALTCNRCFVCIFFPDWCIKSFKTTLNWRIRYFGTICSNILSYLIFRKWNGFQLKVLHCLCQSLSSRAYYKCSWGALHISKAKKIISTKHLHRLHHNALTEMYVKDRNNLI